MKISITRIFFGTCVMAGALLVSCGSNLFSDILYAFDSANKEVVPETPPDGLELVDLTSAGGLRVTGWLKRAPNSKAPMLIYFHGNAMNISRVHTSGLLDKMADMNVNVLVWDYPAYGLSTGVPSQASIQETGQLIIDWAMDQFPKSKIVLWGRSLGTGPATLLAAKNGKKVDGLVITSGWNSAWKLIKAKTGLSDSFCKDQAKGNEFESEVWAKSVTAPALVLHGTVDDVIPFALGEELGKSFTNGKFVAIPDKSHNDIFNDPQFWVEIENHIKSL